MAIAFRSAIGSNNGSGATTITMTVPTGVVDGDILVMGIDCRASSGIVLPSGWTALTGQNDGVSSASSTYWRQASSEPASYSVTLPASVKASGTMIALSAGAATAPVAAQFGSTQNASSVAAGAPALGAWTSQNGIDLYFAGWSVGGDVLTGIAPASYTNAASSQSTLGLANTRTQSVVAYRALSAVTTVGAITASDTTAAINTGQHIFIFESPILLIQQAGNAATTTSLVVTLGAAPQVGNALFAFVTDTLGVTGITGGGVTWTNLVSAGGQYGSAIWGGFGSTGVGTAITLTTASTTIAAQVAEFSGVGASDLTAVHGQTVINPNVGPLTPNNAVTLALANMGWNTAATVGVAGGGFINLTQQVTGTTKVQGAYKVLAAIAAQTASWTFSVSTSADEEMVFTNAAPAAGNPDPLIGAGYYGMAA